MQDGAYVVEKGTIMRKVSDRNKGRIGSPSQRDRQIEMALRNLERQRAPSTMMDIDREIESPTQGDSYVQTPDNNVENIQNDEANDLSQGFIPALGALGMRKRSNRLTSRVVNALQVNLAAIPKPTKPREENINDEEVQANEIDNMEDLEDATQGTSKRRGRGNRGKYKSYVVDMKIKGKGSKLSVYIPDEIDRAIGENARHLVNECGRVVRTKAPLDVRNWQGAFSVAGERQV
ncbi:uncharacterized protein LOC110731946 isoform X3 [Chenopodium quinoa]|uniref:uncharacterized protein LOC110731946 isoform X3 n=1 Tax=Chenopodium quinoa TaxID=63459 RepID=UPI000B7814DF|nr:uncharacterized protein LOC110731946 isoform X3 [Chenopodium quinoa]XP_021767555.1 uncharacterized protein LOC110731946 isoform X3 [Chenopodium quinoa]XP_021767556.1 uncharacterized protein LOC110731946 isoform X3 [Chenopodium quinoa]